MNKSLNYTIAKDHLKSVKETMDAMVIEATAFQEALQKVTDGYEADDLVIELGKIMDDHAKKMEGI